jgi:hypothetical protein
MLVINTVIILTVPTTAHVTMDTDLALMVGLALISMNALNLVLVVTKFALTLMEVIIALALLVLD